MNKELELEIFKREVLSKYAEDSEKYTIEKDNVVKANNHAWLIKYYRNPSKDNVISVLSGDIPEAEQAHWNEYRI